MKTVFVQLLLSFSLAFSAHAESPVKQDEPQKHIISQVENIDQEYASGKISFKEAVLKISDSMEGYHEFMLRLRAPSSNPVKRYAGKTLNYLLGLDYWDSGSKKISAEIADWVVNDEAIKYEEVFRGIGDMSIGLLGVAALGSGLSSFSKIGTYFSHLKEVSHLIRIGGPQMTPTQSKLLMEALKKSGLELNKVFGSELNRTNKLRVYTALRSQTIKQFLNSFFWLGAKLKIIPIGSLPTEWSAVGLARYALKYGCSELGIPSATSKSDLIGWSAGVGTNLHQNKTDTLVSKVAARSAAEAKLLLDAVVVKTYLWASDTNTNHAAAQPIGCNCRPPVSSSQRALLSQKIDSMSDRDLLEKITVAQRSDGMVSIGLHQSVTGL